jgi:hypothetical protein
VQDILGIPSKRNRILDNEDSPMEDPGKEQRQTNSMN